MFAENVKTIYTSEEHSLIETIVKNGIYDAENEILTLMKEETEMYEQIMEILKDDIDKKCAEAEERGIEIGEARGEARGRAIGESARKELEGRIKYLEKLLGDAGIAAV